MHHKCRRHRTARAGCKLCKPWKMNGFATGSHHIYKHSGVNRVLSIQPRGDKARPYQIDQFLDIVEEFGLKIGK